MAVLLSEEKKKGVAAIFLVLLCYTTINLLYSAMNPTFEITTLGGGAYSIIEKVNAGASLDDIVCSQSRGRKNAEKACMRFWESVVDLSKDDRWYSAYKHSIQLEANDYQDVGMHFLPWSYLYRQDIKYVRDEFDSNVKKHLMAYMNVLNEKQ
ncbi:MAG: hypothetical protein CL840_00035 [Crocinitomicaceae bacterium]|nr:hypothetical protein [Crocinitomicaceae bacterium]